MSSETKISRRDFLKFSAIGAAGALLVPSGLSAATSQGSKSKSSANDTINIGFIGLGLIGGSIAKAIRKYHEDYRLLAYDQDRETLAVAVSSNMIDAVCEEHDERFRSCDYIFLCAPVIQCKIS